MNKDNIEALVFAFGYGETGECRIPNDGFDSLNR